MTWKSALTRAIKEEVAAEQAVTEAEGERRRTWWVTTWALAAVPRPEWAEAQEMYVQRTGHTKDHANVRRSTGTRLTETGLEDRLPQARFAIAVSKWIGAKADEAKVEEAIKLLADAEQNELSVREFHQALTGNPWTNAPENMTEADEDAVVEKVAARRPHVVAKQVAKAPVAKAVASTPAATKSVIQQRMARTTEINRKRKAAAAAAPGAAAQAAAVTDASQAAQLPSNSPEYNRVTTGIGSARTGWLDGLRKQSFTDMDRSHMASDLPSFERFLEEIRAYVEAEDDPYDAAVAKAKEHRDQLNLEMDLAEHDEDISSIDEIEKFANEASAS